MNLKNKILLVLALISLILVVLQISQPQPTKKLPVKQLISECLPQQQKCQFSIEQLNFSLEYSKDIYYLKPYQVRLYTEEKDGHLIKQATIDFQMKNMPMGINRFVLKKAGLKEGKQQWQSQIILPVCVTGRVDWYAQVDIVMDGVDYRVITPVIVQRPPR